MAGPGRLHADDPATGTAEWGDNLSGDAKLKVGSPIRVELGLFDDTGACRCRATPSIKLEPSKLDRESAYGTLATADGRWVATTPPPTSSCRCAIYDSAVTFSIQNVATGAYVVPAGTQPDGRDQRERGGRVRLQPACVGRG